VPPLPQAVADMLRAQDSSMSTASWAIRYAASMPGVMVVLSGMSTLEQVEDNVSYMENFKPLTEQEMETVCGLCGAFGKVEQVSEKLFDVVTAVSGSSPAYVFMFIEAMADAAVQGGMPRAMAYKFASQAVLGSAKMVLDTGKHPGELKDMVTSPAGTTIEAVRVLEEKGFRSAVFECVKACTEKSASL
jgi:pyrroline-5-carboxylate reductase